MSITKGQRIQWRWLGTAPHNVDVTKGPAKFSSTTQMKGSFSKKLTKKGTYSDPVHHPRPRHEDDHQGEVGART